MIYIALQLTQVLNSHHVSAVTLDENNNQYLTARLFVSAGNYTVLATKSIQLQRSTANGGIPWNRNTKSRIYPSRFSHRLSNGWRLASLDASILPPTM